MSLYLIPYVGSPEAREQRAALRRRAAEKEAKRLAAEAREHKRRLAALLKEAKRAAEEEADLLRPDALPSDVNPYPMGSGFTGNQVVNFILKEVANYYRLSVLDLVSSRRTAEVVKPRQVAMWLCKERTTYSLPQIGRKIGGRDHTTILFGIRQVEKRRLENDVFAAELAKLLARVPVPSCVVKIENDK